jgi:pyruvate,water dikinase
MSEQELHRLFTMAMREILDIKGLTPLMLVAISYTAAIFHLCKRWLGDDKHSIANQLMAGVGGLEDAQSGFDLWDLAKRVSDDPQLMEMIQSGRSFEDIRPSMVSFDSGRSFLATWEEFMVRHGHLCRGEIEVGNPRWSEQPDRILEMLRNFLPNPEQANPHKRKEISVRRREDLFADCRKRLNPLKRWIFSSVSRKAQLGSQVRENVKNLLTRSVALMRRVLLDLDERFVNHGVLCSTGEIFFLAWEELQEVLDGRIEPEEIRRRIACRRREYEYNCSLNPPPIVVGRYDPARHVQAPPDHTVQILNGLSVSPGIVSGPARVILHTSDDFVRPGEILVAPFTDPGWTPYFVNAAGIVMDQGGLLSHGSIVAREFGIPCVVNVGPATRIIRNGQAIRVDGNAGTVYLTD